MTPDHSSLPRVWRAEDEKGHEQQGLSRARPLRAADTHRPPAASGTGGWGLWVGEGRITTLLILPDGGERSVKVGLGTDAAATFPLHTRASCDPPDAVFLLQLAPLPQRAVWTCHGLAL